MSEQNLWNKVRPGLVQAADRRIRLTRHEEALQAGIPDFSYTFEGCTGWVEMKYEKHWPKKLPDRLEPEQKSFLWSEDLFGGSAWVLHQVYCDILLFTYPNAMQAIGREKASVIQLATGHWYRGIDYGKLLHWLTHYYQAKQESHHES